MDIEDPRYNPHALVTSIITRFTDADLQGMSGNIRDAIIRRLIDTLYAELLPVMRERVSKSLDALAIARCIEEEIANAVHDALGGK